MDYQKRTDEQKPAPAFVLPNPEFREPQEFLDETWLRTLYLGESVLQGFRLSRRLASDELAPEPRFPAEDMSSLRSLWFNSVRQGRAGELVQRLAQRGPRGCFPFQQIFERVAELVARHRVPTSWPLAVAALIDGVIEGYRLQTKHFGMRVPDSIAASSLDTALWMYWPMVNEIQTLSYVGSQTSDEEMARDNARRRGLTTTRRLNKRDPQMYRELARSLIKGCSVMVSRSDRCVLLAGYRLRPTTLIFFRIGPGTSYEVPLSQWMETTAPDEDVTLIDVGWFKPELPYELPDLLAL